MTSENDTHWRFNVQHITPPPGVGMPGEEIERMRALARENVARLKAFKEKNAARLAARNAEFEQAYQARKAKRIQNAQVRPLTARIESLIPN